MAFNNTIHDLLINTTKSLYNIDTTNIPWLDKIFTNTSFGHRLLERLTFTNFRHSLYLISPYETTVDSIDKVPNYNIQVSTWWLMLIFIEFVILYFKKESDKFALNDSVTSICAGMLSQCFKFGGRAVAIFGYVFIWNNFRVLELPWDSPWTWILCLFTQDFMYYLGHRAVHEAGFFWGLHTIHHSSEYYNFSTALRQAAIQDAGLAFYDIIQAFFIPPPIFLVHRYFSEIFQFWMHTSLLGTLGPLGIIFNTPSHHRVHHGRNAYCIDKNYGGVFIIWDKMFNTFEAERLDDPPIYGLVTTEKSFNQLYLQFHTIFDILFKKGLMKDEKGNQLFPGLLNKIKAVLFPPGYFPGVDVYLFFHWFSMKNPSEGVPEIEKPVIIYNPIIPTWIKLYCLSHFILLLSIFLHFEYDREKLGYIDFSMKIAFFVVSMQSFGAFFDNKWYGNLIEIFRCVGVLIYYGIKVTDHIGFGPNRIFVLTLFSSSLLMWIGYTFEQFKNKKIRATSGDYEEKKGHGNVISKGKIFLDMEMNVNGIIGNKKNNEIVFEEDNKKEAQKADISMEEENEKKCQNIMTNEI
uniref:Alkylglycerol monooxygenase n=1 Tax=Strongyloides venezuelensis TaxID=75913 RepID=A0A0K0F7P7_STRVS